MGSVGGMARGITDAGVHVADAAGHDLPDGRQLAVTWGIPDRFADGSVAVRDERQRGDGPERLTTAFAPDGAQLRQWTGAWVAPHRADLVSALSAHSSAYGRGAAAERCIPM